MIRVFEPKLSLKDKFFVYKSLAKNEISGTSKYVKKFEDNFASYCDREFGIGLSNGSVALDVAVNLLNLEDGDEVIVPSHTIISCLSAIIRNNGKPVFCDVDKKTWNMSLEDIEKVYTDKTRAIIVVHTFGLPAQISLIEEFCKKNNIYLIEDSAEAHGQLENGRKCGSFGDLSTFSFYANKHITTGEGGMILTNNKKFYNNALQLRNLDFTSQRFKHENLYWNYRLSGIQASLGISQLEDIDKTINFKIKQGNKYIELFKDYLDLFQLPLRESNGSINHFWVFGVVLKKENIRDKIINKLFDKGIETRPFFWPLHLQPALEKYSIKSNNLKLEVCEQLGKNGLYIPLGKHINFKDQEYIVKSLVDSVRTNN